MAKKGQVQLQTEINTDEEWDKLLQKSGLIVVDIYSDWCGPCSAMSATLKKIKLEIGGDNLQLALAKSDHISYLQRFRKTSEPTWMFIVEGKMVNLMFGANAPKLTRLIIDELKKEVAVKEGTRERVAKDISELADEERVRYDIAKKIEDEAVRVETEKQAKLLHERRLEVANVVSNSLPLFGVILVFPQAVEQVQATLAELWEPSGLEIAITEKRTFTEEMIEELLYFADNRFTDIDIDCLLKGQSVAYAIKPYDPEVFSGEIDTAVLQFVYGDSKRPPGSPDSPAQLLIGNVPIPTDEPEDAAPPHSVPPSLTALPSIPSLSAFRLPSSTKQSKVGLESPTKMRSKAELGSKVDVGSKTGLQSKADLQSKSRIQSKSRMSKTAMGSKSKVTYSKLLVQSKNKLRSGTSILGEEVPDEAEEDTLEVSGLWAPQNARTKATAIKLLFSKLYDPIAVPEPVPTPPHIAIAFEAFKRRDILAVMNDYPNDIMRFGFFTDDNPETAQLIAKTPHKYDRYKAAASTTGEKLVIQLSKKSSIAWCAFSQLSPSYMSYDVHQGEEQCKMFFPEGYDEVEEEEEEEVVEVVTEKKKKGKKGKKEEEEERGVREETQGGNVEEVFEEGEGEEEEEDEEEAEDEGGDDPDLALEGFETIPEEP